ncbi:MAG TPA: glycoside hydrolase family 15 protein [Verrucomicrobiae bacterium]|nr:glycoside hydrolase family 15 protein [Verrucomicrobiae bacterium]
MRPSHCYQPIENYGVIGNLHTVALAGMNGSIDFLCLPRFDSPSVFASLLDVQRGGHFRIEPLETAANVKQSYLADTNILLTRFLSDTGVAEITDFMPLRQLGHGNELVRLVRGVRGEVRLRMECAPKFNYARSGHQIARARRDVIFRPEVSSQPPMRLRSSVPLRVVEGAAVAEFTLREGQTQAFVFEEFTAGDAPSDADDYPARALEETADFWREWIGHSQYRGRWREMVNRSALTLKLLISQPHGSIVAAPTFSLPSEFGGTHNWDYRYTWIRDGCFTVDALMRLGFTEEAGAFASWIEDRCIAWDGRKSLAPLYRVDGGDDLREFFLPQFEGYLGSQPVRVGNDACAQLQLDLGGELLDALLSYHESHKEMSQELWANISRLVEWVWRHWRQPDKSIWEFRTPSREFLYSRVLCWVALDRGIRLAVAQSLPAPLMRWHEMRDRIYQDIHRNFFDAKLGAFVQYRGAKSVDASAFLLPPFRFISAADPRWTSTMRVLEKELSEDFLLYRYNGPHAAPDRSGPRGAFCMCSFWWSECLARAGKLQRAQDVFERMLSYANHLGLYAEQISPNGRHQGNFPQGLSHCGLIRAASCLDAALENPTGRTP